MTPDRNNFRNEQLRIEAEERAAQLEQALSKLVTKLDAMQEPLNGMCVIGHVHGMPYTGPNWAEEMTAAKAVLAALVSARPPETETPHDA